MKYIANEEMLEDVASAFEIVPLLYLLELAKDIVSKRAMDDKATKSDFSLLLVEKNSRDGN